MLIRSATSPVAAVTPCSQCAQTICSRTSNTHEAELRKLLAVDLLIVDDFALDVMNRDESRPTTCSSSAITPAPSS